MAITEELSLEIERRIVELLQEARKEQGLSELEWGRRAYPEIADPRRKIQALKNNQGNGQPQRLRVGDMTRLAKAIGCDPVRIYSKVLDEKNL